MDVRGKDTVVIGGGSGIGRGIALVLAEAGAHVADADIEKPAADLRAREEAEQARNASRARGGSRTAPDWSRGYGAASR